MDKKEKIISITTEIISKSNDEDIQLIQLHDNKNNKHVLTIMVISNNPSVKMIIREAIQRIEYNY
jgi:hypothetical protein